MQTFLLYLCTAKALPGINDANVLLMHTQYTQERSDQMQAKMQILNLRNAFKTTAARVKEAFGESGSSKQNLTKLRGITIPGFQCMLKIKDNGHGAFFFVDALQTAWGGIGMNKLDSGSACRIEKDGYELKLSSDPVCVEKTLGALGDIFSYAFQMTELPEGCLPKEWADCVLKDGYKTVEVENPSTRSENGLERVGVPKEVKLTTYKRSRFKTYLQPNLVWPAELTGLIEAAKVLDNYCPMDNPGGRLSSATLHDPLNVAFGKPGWLMYAFVPLLNVLGDWKHLKKQSTAMEANPLRAPKVAWEKLWNTEVKKVDKAEWLDYVADTLNFFGELTGDIIATVTENSAWNCAGGILAILEGLTNIASYYMGYRGECIADKDGNYESITDYRENVLAFKSTILKNRATLADIRERTSRQFDTTKHFEVGRIEKQLSSGDLSDFKRPKARSKRQTSMMGARMFGNMFGMAKQPKPENAIVPYAPAPETLVPKWSPQQGMVIRPATAIVPDRRSLTEQTIVPQGGSELVPQIYCDEMFGDLNIKSNMRAMLRKYHSDKRGASEELDAIYRKLIQCLNQIGINIR